MSDQATSARRDAAVVECRNLAKSFTVRGREIRVLDGIDLRVAEGEVVVVTGKSGAGKSVLLSLLAGLDRQTAGTVTFKGRRLEELSNAELAQLRREQIGVIFQNFNLLPSWTGLENVEAALLHTAIPKSGRREKARALLEGLGLGDRLDNLPGELSAGEQQRVALARSLANEPSLILADEPTADVDPETGDEITQRLVGQARKNGVTLIVATHGAFPLDAADRVFVIREGRLQPPGAKFASSAR
jgi:ABC-type lipoprotein export system ATPase subunit